MSVSDFQHSTKLLAHPEMKMWGKNNDSSLLWINSHQNGRTVDWVSVFATNIIDRAQRLNGVTVLQQFCVGSYANKIGASPCTIVSAMIFQILRTSRNQFLNNQSPGLSIERFEEAKADLRQLWDIFKEVLATAKLTCVWLVIDHIDVLVKGGSFEETLQLLAFLNGLVQDESIIVKVFVTARLGGSTPLSSHAAESGALSASHPIVNVPRGYQRHDAAMRPQTSRRPHRLPIVAPKRTKSTSGAKPDCAAVRFSSEDSSDSEEFCKSKTDIPKKPAPTTKGKSPQASSSDDSDSSLSSLLLSSDERSSEDDSDLDETRGANAKQKRAVDSDESSDDDWDELSPLSKPQLIHRNTWDTETADSDDLGRLRARLSYRPAVLVKPPASKNEKRRYDPDRLESGKAGPAAGQAAEDSERPILPTMSLGPKNDGDSTE